MLYLIIGFVGGVVACYFVLRHNPKYLSLKNVAKLGKEGLEELQKKIKEELAKD